MTTTATPTPKTGRARTSTTCLELTSSSELTIAFAPDGGGLLRVEHAGGVVDLLLEDLPAAVRLRDALDDLVHRLVLDQVRADGSLLAVPRG